LQESFAQEVERRCGDEGIAWTFDTLYRDVNRVLRIDAELGGEGYPKDCDVLLAACLDILRREEYRPVRISQWEAEQRARNPRP